MKIPVEFDMSLRKPINNTIINGQNTRMQKKVNIMSSVFLKKLTLLEPAVSVASKASKKQKLHDDVDMCRSISQTP